MKIRFLGTRAHIEESSKWHRKTSSTLFMKKQFRLLIDCGYDHNPEQINPRIIFLTHAHPDHAFGLSGLARLIPTYMTRITFQLLKKNGISPARVILFRERQTLSRGFKIHPIPVLHSKLSPTVGFIIDDKVAYFPDVLLIAKKDRKWLNGCKVYIGDGSSLDRSIVRYSNGTPIGHRSIIQQIAWAKQAEIKKIYFTHIGRQIVRQNPSELSSWLSSQFNSQIEILSDGQTIEV